MIHVRRTCAPHMYAAPRSPIYYAIESRFSWFRQLASVNYYISTRQVLEGDKKIRALSLVKFSHFSMSEIDQEMSVSSDLTSATSIDSVADSIADAITSLPIDRP